MEDLLADPGDNRKRFMEEMRFLDNRPILAVAGLVFPLSHLEGHDSLKVAMKCEIKGSRQETKICMRGFIRRIFVILTHQILAKFSHLTHLLHV